MMVRQVQNPSSHPGFLPNKDRRFARFETSHLRCNVGVIPKPLKVRGIGGFSCKDVQGIQHFMPNKKKGSVRLVCLPPSD